MIHASFSSPVNASVEVIWNLLLDKIEHPGRYIKGIERCRIISRDENVILREMKMPERTIVERIIIDAQAKEIKFVLVEHPQFCGEVINKITPLIESYPHGLPILTFTLSWEPINEELQRTCHDELTQKIHGALLHTKNLAEQQEADMRVTTTPVQTGI